MTRQESAFALDRNLFMEQIKLLRLELEKSK